MTAPRLHKHLNNRGADFVGFDFKLFEDEASDMSGESDITGKAITQFTGAGTDGAKQAIIGLNAEEQKWLQVAPYKGSLPTPVPTDPLIYRWYEIVNVYGSTIKELIHEEFGDGIMSAIDFSMDIVR